MQSKFVTTEEVDGHRWGTFVAPPLLGGKDFECCANCGMIRRADKKNTPCKGAVKVGPRAALAAHDAAGGK